MATDLSTQTSEEIGDIEKYNFRTETTGVFKARKGIDAEIVNQISDIKEEPDWMREFRLKSLAIFESKPTPTWGGDIALDFQDIFYYLKPTEQQGRTWDDVPAEIKETFDRLGIPEAERQYLSGVKAQFESEVVYGSLQEDRATTQVVRQSRRITEDYGLNGLWIFGRHQHSAMGTQRMSKERHLAKMQLPHRLS